MYAFKQNLLADYATNVFGQDSKQGKFRFGQVGARRIAAAQQRASHEIDPYPLQIDDDVVVGAGALQASICENVADA